MSHTVSLPTWYYRQFPSDIRRGEEATRGVLGWARKDCEIPQDQMALVLMHFWDVGFPGGPEWSADCPEAARRLAQEYVGRCVFEFTRTMPPILEAARKAGMTIIHVASSEDYAKKYPGYDIACSETDLDPTPRQPGAIRPDNTDVPTTDERFGPGFSACNDVAYDFPVGIGPEGDELVVVQTHQLNSVLRHRNIWQLTYCGFAINWCLWHSPCGMIDMHRLGYTCGCIKQGVVAVESKESVATRANHEYAMWKTAHMFGYVLDDHDYITALAT